MAGMELLTATAREVVATAADRSAFSQENFMGVPPCVPPALSEREERIYFS